MRLIACSLIFFLLASLTAKANTLQQDLDWLTGDWRSSSPSGILEEHWSAPIKNNMLGASRFIRSNKAENFFELMTLEKNGKDWEMRIVHFRPQLVTMHDKPLIYKLIKHAPQELVFENIGIDPVHYIIYRCIDKKTLSVSLLAANNEIKEEFKFNFFDGNGS